MLNQVFLGNNPVSSLDDIDLQIKRMEAYKQRLKQIQTPQKLIWDDIDAEINPMTEEQKSRLLQNDEYKEVYLDIQSLVQTELLNLIKDKIENTERGKDLLSKQLKIVRKLKNKIINDTNREMELFNKFRNYSKQHPNITYEEFIKDNI